MAHVLLFPFPAQGHVPPFLKLAELLSRADLFITFVNTEHIHHRFLASSPTFDRLARLSRFRFRTVPDGLREEDPRLFVDFLDVEGSLRTRSREHYRELLVPGDGRDDPDGWPPVTCVVGDGVLPLALEVAEEVGLPVLLLRTSSACSVWSYYSIPKLVETGDIPFPEEADHMDELVQGVAGMESFLRRRDLPGLLRRAKSLDDPTLKFLMAASKNLARGRALIMNTTECLESPVLSHLSSICPVIYTVGPLQNLLQNFGPCHPVSNLTAASNSASLWQKDMSCLKWLDSHPDKSVVYVSFGSVTVVSREELVEFWHGLVDSDRPFLWVIRPDMVEAGGEPTMPSELETATRERGCLVAWAPQEEVLAHPSVGCFLTHSGWNSTLESIVAGVPMICWPFFADQQVNSRFVSEVWKVGVDMKDLCGRSIVEGMVRKVMDGGEVGEELNKSATELSREVCRAAEEGGSSYTNFQKLVDHIESLSSQKYQGIEQRPTH